MITQFCPDLFLAFCHCLEVIADTDNFGCLRQITRIVRSYLRPEPDGLTLSIDMRSFWILDVPSGIGVEPWDQPCSSIYLNVASGGFFGRSRITMGSSRGVMNTPPLNPATTVVMLRSLIKVCMPRGGRPLVMANAIPASANLATACRA